MLHEALDRAALARRVTTLEKDDDAFTGLLHPVLNLEKLDLQLLLVVFIDRAANPILVRVDAGAEQLADLLGVVP